ncbi:cyclopropane-fatty-acyl-phospholipid synthase family protein [Saccharopolyspora sp.]|uniref:SAM-dependent methyltransferase n=1 Tax=Saccharopolyspora sp. TaxID=33915 RepID=UPI00345DA0EF
MGIGEEGTAMTDANGTAEHWDARYGEHEQFWSGNPNTALVEHVAHLDPGRALDLGCGEGADAIWLAEQGWQVTAVDVSGEALRRAQRAAEEAGVAGRIDWRRMDLASEFPRGEFDLISAQFLHSEVELPREEILRTAAAAVVPGGVLLIEGHANIPDWAPQQYHDHDVHLPSSRELLETLGLGEEWEVLVCAEHERIQNGPDGYIGARQDTTLKLRRSSAARSR